MPTITVRGHFPLPPSATARRKEKVIWVEPAGGTIHVIFLDRTPVDFQTDNPARARVIGVVKDDAELGSYRYRLGGVSESEPEPAATDGSVLADPELIVSGGLTRKRTKRTKRAVSKRSTKARKRAPAKRATPARRRKTTRRVKSTSRVSSRKRATKKR